jgi:hypothetical protein
MRFLTRTRASIAVIGVAVIAFFAALDFTIEATVEHTATELIADMVGVFITEGSAIVGVRTGRFTIVTATLTTSSKNKD